MGGCATKPKVSKDDPDVKAKTPEPEPEPLKEEAVYETKVPQHETTVDDDQQNKRRSLSLLFNKENDDTKVSKENEKTAVEETVKKETLEAEKPSEDSKSNEPIVKLESSNAEEEKKVLNNEAAKQMSPLIELEEKPSGQNEINKLAEEPEKLESKNEKIIEEIQRSESLKQEFVDAKETYSVETENKEPIKQEPLPKEAGKPSGEPEKNGSKAEKSETLVEENMNTKIVTQPEEKVIEALLTDSGSVQKNITEEATSSREEKNHDEVKHAFKATDAGSIKT